MAFDHEHGRLYEALKTAEERAELAGDNGIARDLRTLRARVAQHIEERDCEELPDDVLHARQVEDDYAEAARQAAYVADGR